GSWSTAEEFEPGAMGPKAMTGGGTEVIRRGPGGFSLISDYNSKNPGGSFVGHGIIAWDDKNHIYNFVWLDSTSPALSTMTGKWESGDLVFTTNTEVGGKPTYLKLTYRDLKPDSFTLTEEASTEGGPLQRLFTVHFRRARSAKASK